MARVAPDYLVAAAAADAAAAGTRAESGSPGWAEACAVPPRRSDIGLAPRLPTDTVQSGPADTAPAAAAAVAAAAAAGGGC